MTNVFLTPPRAAHVSIVSDEQRCDLKPLVDALARRSLDSEIITGAVLATGARPGVRYLRRLDPALTNLAYVARSISRAGGLADINPPRSVRLTEWAPLENHTLRRAGVAQPRRVWCIDAHDVRRAAESLGLPIVIQGVASRARVLAETASHVESAAQTVESGAAPYGVLLEQPLDDACSLIDALVVARRVAGFAFGGRSQVNTLDAAQIERAAVRAVDALGGDIMAVALAIDGEGSAYVREVDAAPALSRFGRHACDSVADEIAGRVARARATNGAWRKQPRLRHGEAARITSASVGATS